MLSLNELSPLSERKLQKAILLAAYCNLCRHPLHKHPPKKKITPKPKKRYSISLTTSKVTFIPTFDGTVMAISKELPPLTSTVPLFCNTDGTHIKCGAITKEK